MPIHQENKIIRIIRNDQNQIITTIGINDTIIVGMKDAILVADKNQTQHVKNIVQTLKSKKIEQAEKQKKDFRPWGNFESLLTENNFHVKILTVLSGESLSLQKHKFRSENWVVVSGLAKVTLNQEIKELKVGESIFIPKGAVHRLENEQKINLVLIEVQTGEYLGEDDIIRLEDKYFR